MTIFILEGGQISTHQLFVGQPDQTRPDLLHTKCLIKNNFRTMIRSFSFVHSLVFYKQLVWLIFFLFSSFFEAYGYISFSGKYIELGSLQRCASGTETTESECREAAGELGLDLGARWDNGQWSGYFLQYPSGCWKHNGPTGPDNQRVFFNTGGNKRYVHPILGSHDGFGRWFR